jgi:hypothetical protein
MKYSYLMPKRDDPDKISQLCSYFKNLPWFTENMGRSHLTEKIFPICSMDEVSVPNKATYPLKIESSYLNDHHNTTACFTEG